MTAIDAPKRKSPWHLWVVAVLTLLWNGSGAVTILLAQMGRLPNIPRTRRRITPRSRCGSSS